METATSNATLAKYIKSDTESRVRVMRIVRLIAKLAFDEIQHCGFSSRAGNYDNARMPALERNIRKKFEVARRYQI